jgi:hypothetical protein
MTFLYRKAMDVSQSASSIASPIVTPSSPPLADTRGPVAPPPDTTQLGGTASTGDEHVAPEEEVMHDSGADISAPERYEDPGAGNMGAETESTRVPKILEQTQSQQQQQQQQQPQQQQQQQQPPPESPRQATPPPTQTAPQPTPPQPPQQMTLPPQQRQKNPPAKQPPLAAHQQNQERRVSLHVS